MEQKRASTCAASQSGRGFPDSDFDGFIDPAKIPPPPAGREEDGRRREGPGSRWSQAREQDKKWQLKPRSEVEEEEEEDEEDEEDEEEQEEDEDAAKEVFKKGRGSKAGISNSIPQRISATEEEDEEHWVEEAVIVRSAVLGNVEEEPPLDRTDSFGEDDDWEADIATALDPEFVKQEVRNPDGGEAMAGPELRTQKDGRLEETVYRVTLGELLDEAGVAPMAVEGDLDVVISGIQLDSRQVTPGDLFVCCTGLKSDGHLHAVEAVEKGAVAVVASREVDVDESVKALVLVEDSNGALSALADAFYRHPSRELLVVGITGTNGKTTTSFLVRSIYEAMGLKTGLLGTIMYSIGEKEVEASNTTPDAVHLQKLMASMVHQNCEACVMEVSSHGLALGRTTHVDFDVAVFTNLTRDHMDFHKTEEEYREAKGRLFERMQEPDRHRKVINIDDPNAQYFIDRGNSDVPIVTYGLENDQADVYPLEVSLSLFETELVVETPKGSIELSSGLLGRHNVSNILAAIAVGVAVEAPLEDIVKGIEEVDTVPGRCELIDEEQAFAVIVDYAHSPDALARLLDTVRECGPNRIITVVGCGGDRDRGKRPMMAKIATDRSEITILTSDNPRSEQQLDIIDDMLAGVGWTMEEYLASVAKGYVPPLPNRHRLYVHDCRGVAVRAAVAMGEEGDAVVIAGKGHETYQILGSETNYFDDREECREALANVDDVRSWFNTSEIPWRLIDIEDRPRRGAV